MNADSPSIRQSLVRRLDRWEQRSLVAGLVGLAVCAAAAFFNLTQFFQSYLLAYLFWWSIAIGCLGLALLYHLVGGAWGAVTRPFFGAGIGTLPLLAFGFLPLAFGLEHLYLWAVSAEVAQDPYLAEKARWYLNPPFFLGRAAGYFVAWILLGYIANAWYFSNLERTGAGFSRGLSRLSGGGLVLLVLTVSFAAIDWGMSLEPHWFSTIYGGLIAVGGVLSAMALVVAAVALFGVVPSLVTGTSSQVLNDLGNLLLAFLMLWAYFAFSQYLIIWSGNLPDPASWYFTRLENGWEWVALAVVIFHFVLPFMLLLSRETKQNPQALGSIAAALVVMHLVDHFWTIAPSFPNYRDRVFLHWADPAAVVGIGGLWVALFCRQLKGRLLPILDRAPLSPTPAESTPPENEEDRQ